MEDSRTLQRSLEEALAYAHAALDDPSGELRSTARACADEVLPRVRRLRRNAFTLAEARQLGQLVLQLKNVLAQLAPAA